MLIVLPPSETKAVGGDQAPLDFASLSFPSLNPVREEIARDLQSLDREQARAVLKLSAAQDEEILLNEQLFKQATMPAIFRYTGVLYSALDPKTLPTPALAHLSVGSALFGIVHAQDCIPHYRLSGSVKLPTADGQMPTLKARWGSRITEVLEDRAAQELVIDLRSGTYQQLGKCNQAYTLRVEQVRPDGSRKVVSHFNKHYKGIVARELLLAATIPGTIEEVLVLCQDAGLDIRIQEGKKAKELLLSIPA